jgi:hypothetical protein
VRSHLISLRHRFPSVQTDINTKNQYFHPSNSLRTASKRTQRFFIFFLRSVLIGYFADTTSGKGRRKRTVLFRYHGTVCWKRGKDWRCRFFRRFSVQSNEIHYNMFRKRKFHSLGLLQATGTPPEAKFGSFANAAFVRLDGLQSHLQSWSLFMCSSS